MIAQVGKPQQATVLAQIAAIEEMVRQLEEMEEAKQLRSWSVDIRHHHMMAIDDLRVLVSFLEVYRHGLGASNH